MSRKAKYSKAVQKVYSKIYALGYQAGLRKANGKSKRSNTFNGFGKYIWANGQNK